MINWPIFAGLICASWSWWSFMKLVFPGEFWDQALTAHSRLLVKMLGQSVHWLFGINKTQTANEVKISFTFCLNTHLQPQKTFHNCFHGLSGTPSTMLTCMIALLSISVLYLHSSRHTCFIISIIHIDNLNLNFSP